MEGALRSASPDDLMFVWGAIKAEGFADGDAITVDEEASLYEDYSGVDGEVTRIKNKDRRATVVVRLAESSPTNALFSAQRELDKAGKGVWPLLIKGTGTGAYAGDKCWLAKNPKRTFARGVTVLEWEFRVAKLTRFDGFVAQN